MGKLCCFCFVWLLLILPADAQQRVVSLAPSLTEIVLSLGGADQLVGVTSQCDFGAVAQLDRVGTYIDPSLEAIVALKPDLIIGLPEHQQVLEKLSGRGISGLLVRNQSVSDISASFVRIASAIGKLSQGASLKDALERKLQLWQQKKRQSPLPALLLFGDAGLKQSFAAGSSTLFHEILELCGAQNVVGQRRGYGVLSTEDLLVARPQRLLIVAAHAGKQGGQVRAKFMQELSRLAMSEIQVKVLSASYLVRPGAQLAATIDVICKALGDEHDRSQ